MASLLLFLPSILILLQRPNLLLSLCGGWHLVTHWFIRIQVPPGWYCEELFLVEDEWAMMSCGHAFWTWFLIAEIVVVSDQLVLVSESPSMLIWCCSALAASTLMLWFWSLGDNPQTFWWYILVRSGSFVAMELPHGSLGLLCLLVVVSVDGGFGELFSGWSAVASVVLVCCEIEVLWMSSPMRVCHVQRGGFWEFCVSACVLVACGIVCRIMSIGVRGSIGSSLTSSAVELILRWGSWRSLLHLCGLMSRDFPFPLAGLGVQKSWNFSWFGFCCCFVFGLLRWLLEVSLWCLIFSCGQLGWSHLCRWLLHVSSALEILCPLWVVSVGFVGFVGWGLSSRLACFPWMCSSCWTDL